MSLGAYIARCHVSLCARCAELTPNKVCFSEFCRIYFPDDYVPAATRRAFYEDYRVSKLTLAAYTATTTEDCA